MRMKNLALVTATGMAVAAMVSVGYAGSRAALDVSAKRVDPRQSVGHDVSPAGQTSTAPGVLEAVVPDGPCLTTAIPALAEDTDQRVKDALESNWASQAAPPTKPMTRSAAIDAARMMSTQEQSVGNAESQIGLDLPQAVAVQVSYRKANGWLGGSMWENAMVSPQRCVWVVSVNAPFQPRSAPDPSAVHTFNNYTAMFDALSGQYLGVSAGTDAANLITGDRLDSN